MRKIVLLVVSLLFVVCMPLAGKAEVHVGVGVALPPLVFAAPPDVVVVPSGTSYVYMAPDAPGLYFYHNYWYRAYEGGWYRSSIYNGPWASIDIALVPGVVVGVRPDYIHHLPRGYHRIHYGDLHDHWRSWDRQRHWHRYDWYKHEMREHRHGYRGDGHRGDGHRGDGHRGDGHEGDGRR